ncbi:MAG: hypothetical protein OXN17_00525 [Candidatus Poribacteria bacterium]|nr:hypothetical protein [Candidatus Poribacteria bacterium]MDE0504696.1 hypothetical protein [Candidatus Poribacteria bacterium]
MRAGASIRDVTVPELLGHPSVHDALFARVLVLDDGTNSVAILCLDMVWPSFPEIRERIKQQLGISLTLVNCNHTHSDARGAHDDKWRETVGQSIYEMVEEAYANRVPVTLHAGRASVQLGDNRYGRDFTQEVIPWVNVLAVRTRDDNPLAILFEHAAHPVVTLECGALSADYPGYAIARINEEFGDEVVPMFAQGCGGTVNAEPVGFTVESGWHENAEKAGGQLGEAVITAIHDSVEIEADTLEIRSKTVTLPLRVPSMKQWEKHVEHLRDQHPNDETELNALQSIKGIIERGEQPGLTYCINAVMLGSEWVLVTMAGDVFGEYELFVNAYAPFDHDMTFGYTNSREGEDDHEHYILTDKAIALSIRKPHRAQKSCRDALRVIKASTHENVRLPYAVGIEAIIHDGIKSLWAE